MDKDLRDAYKALTLLRADLARTKKEKRALHDTLTALTEETRQEHDRPKEHALMQNEDMRVRFQELQEKYAVVVRENDALKAQNPALTQRNDLQQQPKIPRKAHANAGDRERELNQHEEPEEEEDNPAAAGRHGAAKMRSRSSNQDHCGSEHTVETEQEDDNDSNASPAHQDDISKALVHGLEQKDIEDASAAVVETMVREKLELLTSLYTLKSKLDEQTSAMLALQAEFVQEREELCLQLEEMGERIVEAQAHAMDVEHEKQFIEEKYDFLVTELELIKQNEPRDAQHTTALEDDGDEPVETQCPPEKDNGEKQRLTAVEAKLREIEAIREALEAERQALAQEKKVHEHQAADRNAHSSTEALLQTNAILQQQLIEKEEQLAMLSVELHKLQENTQSSDYEKAVLELQELQESVKKAERVIGELKESNTLAKEQLALVESEKETLVAAKEMLERDVERLKLEKAALIEDCETKVDTFNHRTELLEKQLQDKEDEIASFKAELETKASRCQQLQETIRVRDDKLDALQSQVKTLMQQEDKWPQRHSEALKKAQDEHDAHMDAVKRDLEDVKAAHAMLVDRYAQLETMHDHLKVEMDESKRQTFKEKERVQLAQKEQQTLFQEQIRKLESEKEDLSRQVDAMQTQLEHEMEAVKLVHANERTQREQSLEAKHAEAIAAAKSHHEKQLKAWNMEKKALLQELRQLKQSIKQREDESITSSQQAAETQELAEYRQSVLETQLMQLEDKKPSADEAEFDNFAVAQNERDSHSKAWKFIQRKVHDLAHFLPQLQAFAFYLDTAFVFCEANYRALDSLTLQQPSAGDSGKHLTQELVAFLRFVTQLRRSMQSTMYLKQARRVHRQVLELLSHWYECGDDDEQDAMPSPPFGIASREASLVLQSWSVDSRKRMAAQQWLERMEVVAPSSQLSENDVLLREGSTLELSSMTVEVKQAFLMLLIPILKRNRALYVRVFTRRRPAAAVDQRDGAGADTCWEMKIHVQFADASSLRRRTSLGAMSTTSASMWITQRRNSSSSNNSNASESPRVSGQRPRMRPPPLTMMTPTASSSNGDMESDSMSTPTSAAHKLQIIQERLRRMQTK
uniref:Uncharacterized protein n=1 Tax=Globisporangium ultimum (strain ATCC 200006 / CBS 805.95 / DAOM BR144) TaxID=431595 RepID=K3WFP4_GLOUD